MEIMEEQGLADSSLSGNLADGSFFITVVCEYTKSRVQDPPLLFFR